MSFFSRLIDTLRGKPPTSGSGRYLPIYVLSNRCHEPVAGQVDLMNELSLDDATPGGYYTRKVLHTSGKHRCFGEVEVELWLDSSKRITRQEVHGGRWLTADEYATEVAAEQQREAEAAAQAEAQAEAQAQQAENQAQSPSANSPVDAAPDPQSPGAAPHSQP